MPTESAIHSEIQEGLAEYQAEQHNDDYLEVSQKVIDEAIKNLPPTIIEKDTVQ